MDCRVLGRRGEGVTLRVASRYSSFERIAGLIRSHGLERMREPYVKHLEGPLWEMRMKGRNGIARAVYVTAIGRRVVVVHVFEKKTQQTPRREIEKALKRVKEVQ